MKKKSLLLLFLLVTTIVITAVHVGAANDAKLTLYGNEGVASDGSTSITYTIGEGEPFVIPANMFKREGYLFDRWNTAEDGTGEYSFSNQDTIKIWGTLNLYAQWKVRDPNIALITFDPNGEVCWTGMETQLVEKGKTTTLAKNEYFSKASRIFTGWNTESDGSGTDYADKASVTTSEDLILYAQWKDVTTYNTETDVVTFIRNQLKARVTPIQFRYIGTWDWDSVWASVLQHTGVPDEGDYLKWQLNGVRTEGPGLSINDVDYNDVTVHVENYYTTAAQEAAVTAEIESILESLGLSGNISGMSDYEKFEPIYRYIVQNVAYKDDGTSHCHTAHAAAVDQQSVCQGYATLLYRMLLTVGIDNRYISGTGTNSLGEQEDHAWNIVKINDKYYYVDATWDSTGVTVVSDIYNNVIRVEYPYNYFLKGSTNFANHTPDSKHTAFLAEYEIDEYDFPVPTPSFATKSLVLSGQIGVNFFMDLTPLTTAEREISYMTFAITGDGIVTERDDFNINDKGVSGVNLFGFTCYVNSIQMADTITATFHYPGKGGTKAGTEVFYTTSLEYSVKDYIEYINLHKAQNWFTPKTIALVEALQNYGYHAQKYFADLYSWTIGTGHAAMPAASTTSYNYDSVKSAVAKYEISRPVAGEIESIQFSVDASSETLIYLYVTMKDETVPTAALIGENEEKTALKPISSGGNEYKYQIASLKASELGKSITVELSGGGTTKVSVSALSYVYAVLNSTAEGIKDLDRNFVSALYYYYDAIQNYMTASN